MRLSARSDLHILVFAAVLATPLAALAQSPPSDYTAAYPTAQTVESNIKGTDPTDTIARQVAVFRRLQNDINNTKYARTIRGPYTPGEQKMLQAYSAAEAQLTQAFTKSHTPDEVAAFNKLCRRYVLNQQVYDDYHRLIGQQGLAAARDADTKTHEDAQRIRERASAASNSAPRSTPSGEPSGAAFLNNMFENDPEVRRCLELGGGTPDDCARNGVNGMGKSAEVAVSRIIGVNPNAGRAQGLILVGAYRSRNELLELTLTSEGKAQLHKCGTLVDEDRAYAIRRSGPATQVVIANEPQPIVLNLRPDGTLFGPGSVTVKGQVVSGYRQGYSRCPVGTAAMNCRTTTEAVYTPSIQRCTLAQLVPQSTPAPAQRPGGAAGALSDFLDTSNHEPVTYGLRLAGSYGGSAGLRLSFTNRFATLDCGKAHINAPYVVGNTPAGFLVQIHNPAGPLLLTLTANDTLRGSGSTTVNGRLISSFHGDNVSYTPHSETCAVGTLTPQ